MTKEIGDEPIGDLDAEIAVDKVFLQDETRLFRTKTVLTYMNTGVYNIMVEPRYENPVPVYSGEKKIGFATVTTEGDPLGTNRRLVAEIAIDYSTEERLLVEIGEERLYARYFGRLGVPGTAFFDLQEPLKVTLLTIDGIVLTDTKPFDERLKALGKPTL